MLDTVRNVALAPNAFCEEVLAGLAQPQKNIRSRWLYDQRGSELFEAITQVDEYYVSRTEETILRTCATQIAQFAGVETVLVEYGAGAGVKTEIVLDALVAPRAYVPIDVADDFLQQTTERLSRRFPGLQICPVVADFTLPFSLPETLPDRRMGFFPGSTIGNFSATECQMFLAQMRSQVGMDGSAVVGIDLIKPLSLLLAAYDDAAGVTAAFNLNLLVRMNRELVANFKLEKFRHEARWNAEASAIEMHLVSQDDQVVSVAGVPFKFRAGESIHTESSRKYHIGRFCGIAAAGGWNIDSVWMDPAEKFALCGLRPSLNAHLRS